MNHYTAKWAHLKPNQHCRLEAGLDGVRKWKNQRGHLHRVDENGIQDGPALIFSDGRQFWWLNDKLHRLDGPACICPDGTQFWFLDGVRLTQEEWARDPRVVEYHSQTPEEAEQWLKRL